VAASNRDLQKEVKAGRFREDLYFRLGVVPINVPALSERVEDIPLLIAHFRKTRGGPSRATFDRDAMMRLMGHEWPGNVRELRNVVERADILFGGMTIGSDEVEQLLGLRSGRPLRIVDLPARAEAISRAEETPVPVPLFPLAAAQASSSTPRTANTPSADPHAPIDLKVLVETMEQERIQMALEAADGVISEAARLLTLKRTTLIEKMRKYGVGKQAA
jgi:sigma-54 specific flagellar transcriptional regulator A